MTARSIKKLDRADIELDAKTTARVVESLVIRGDISALSPEERSRFYVQMCESLGLNPASNPFAILRLNGKEILYPTRGATDQLAAIHKLNREIVDGPRVIDLAGTKMVYCVCRATHPNGRIETAVATVPLADPLNALMKCETKGKRRATLSILGLGMLDECELDTIPAHLKSPGTPIEVPASARGGAPVDVPAEPVVDTTPAVAPPVPELPAPLAHFIVCAEQIELPGEAVALWIKHRAELATLEPSQREDAWKALCKRTEDVGKMKNAKVWLKRAIAEEDCRRSGTGQFGNPTSDHGAPAADVVDDPTEPVTPDAISDLRAALADIHGNDAEGQVHSLLLVAQVWMEHRDAVSREAAGDAAYVHEATRAVLGSLAIGASLNAFNHHVRARELMAADDGIRAVVDEMDSCETLPDLVESYRDNRAAIEALPAHDRDAVKAVAVRLVKELDPRIENPGHWLRAQLDPKPPKGGKPVEPAPAAPVDAVAPPREMPAPTDAAHGDAPDPLEFPVPAPANDAAPTTWPENKSLDAYAAHLTTKLTVTDVENSIAAHINEVQAPEDHVMRLGVNRLRAIATDLGEMAAVNRLRMAINNRVRKRIARSGVAAKVRRATGGAP